MRSLVMSEWVAGLSSDGFIISSPAPAWDYIGHDLAVVWINEDLIYQMSDYGTQTVTPTGCRQLVTGFKQNSP